MTTPIKTKFHHIEDIIRSGQIYLTSPKGGTASRLIDIDPTMGGLAGVKASLQIMEGLPHFVIDNELVHLSRKQEYIQSLLDMKRAGVMRMPFPAMVIEYSNDHQTQIILMRDLHHKGVMPWETDDLRAKMTEYEPDADLYGWRMAIHNDQDGRYVAMSPSTIYIGIQKGDDGQPWVKIHAAPNEIIPAGKKTDKLVEETYQKDAGILFYGAAAAYLLMATGGVEKEIIDTQRINRKRKADGKQLVPRHTYIYIGKVYRSANSEMSDEYIPRKSPRPHWRRGHLKNVRYGAGKEKLREVYIYPKLVSYKGDVEPLAPDYIIRRSNARVQDNEGYVS